MFEFVGHPSEEMVRVEAQTEREVFADAGLALFELMTDTSALVPNARYSLELSAPERMLLLIDWLNRLILLHEVENVFLREFHVTLNHGAEWNLKADVAGQKINAQMERRLHAKSATYGQLQWNETPQGHQVQFVIDI